eukprot:TRINITY_DN16573_c0_g1_i1.p1 TRINITY_DN16573_c0_g1~~TRINITY_DN16573_c0_g1_i1.p1  ORF type:complete len:357 (-),score=33.38 TRINITY_DN16573_c0_g1_i1:114-1184(-)
MFVWVVFLELFSLFCARTVIPVCNDCTPTPIIISTRLATTITLDLHNVSDPTSVKVVLESENTCNFDVTIGQTHVGKGALPQIYVVWPTFRLFKAPSVDITFTSIVGYCQTYVYAFLPLYLPLKRVGGLQYQNIKTYFSQQIFLSMGTTGEQVQPYSVAVASNGTSFPVGTPHATCNAQPAPCYLDTNNDGTQYGGNGLPTPGPLSTHLNIGGGNQWGYLNLAVIDETPVALLVNTSVSSHLLFGVSRIFQLSGTSTGCSNVTIVWKSGIGEMCTWNYNGGEFVGMFNLGVETQMHSIFVPTPMSSVREASGKHLLAGINSDMLLVVGSQNGHTDCEVIIFVSPTSSTGCPSSPQK